MAGPTALPPTPPAVHCRPPARPRPSVRPVRARAGPGSGGAQPGGGPAGVSEEVLARLRAAEEEAAKLRAQLAEAKARAGGGADAAPDVPPAPARRIDGAGLSRESPFAGGDSASNWLNESQVDFFTGGGLSEAAGPGNDDAATAATVQRRLIIGVAATAALAAFALVPTDALRLGRPTKPLFLYLTPLVLAGPALDAARAAAADADWPALASALARIQGPPLELEANLRAAAAHADVTARREAVQELARDAIEYVASVDYNSYFESVGGSGLRGGTREAAFADFSTRAADAAKAKIAAFLALMPADAVEAARERAGVAGGL